MITPIENGYMKFTGKLTEGMSSSGYIERYKGKIVDCFKNKQP